ncbi:MAG TPA: hypothetical protein VHH09_08770, partial [Acidimicrobiales bacterium]|nr:hypothetical protein [Acidimicrobiales bacterium]
MDVPMRREGLLGPRHQLGIGHRHDGGGVVGARPINLIHTGIWDDSEAYDATYSNCNAWGNRRWAKPGAIVDGQLLTTNLT